MECPHLLFQVGVLEEREEQLVGEVGKHLDKNDAGDEINDDGDEKNDDRDGKNDGDEINSSQVEAEGVARRKAEARALEAEGRAQVEEQTRLQETLFVSLQDLISLVCCKTHVLSLCKISYL